MATKILKEEPEAETENKKEAATAQVPAGYVKIQHVLVVAIVLAGLASFWPKNEHEKKAQSAENGAKSSPATETDTSAVAPEQQTRVPMGAPDDDIHRQAAVRSPHAQAPSENPHDNPHITLHAEPDIAIAAVHKPEGPLGRTVEELHQQKDILANKPVQLRGTVVRSTTGIKGMTYLHLRDGTGDPSKETHDVTVTTASEAAVGDNVDVEGIVRKDVDLGLGYHYAVIVENATLQKSVVPTDSSGKIAAKPAPQP